jgi:D-alanyl-lipoteichoic acid acyltransferase DltB (MBOAT superfamily)
MFFSQLVAGPIERPGHMLPQFHKSHPFDPFKVRQGLELMIWGFFKKLVIADKIALLVDYSHAKIQDTSGSMLIFTTILFSYQLYADFSGYSDIALGSALVFGYDLTVNFNRPFASRSIAEFWRRWHISLSSWLRDYLYHPLVFSGKQVTKLRIYLSMFLTFALIGLWHGANWTYVVFGALHGAYLVVSLLTANIRKKIVAFLRLDKVPALHYLLQVVSMFVLVSVSLVFFRSATVSEALLILSKMGNAVLHLRQSLHGLSISSIEEELGTTVRTISAILAAIVFLEAIQYWQGKKGTHFLFDRANRFIRYAWYYTLILSILRFGYLGASAFIYFKF